MTRALDGARVPVREGLPVRRSWLISKRVVDVVLGSVLALAALPFIVALALAVGVSLREWPFFVQRRIGKDGRAFSCPKIRTLPGHTPPYASTLDPDMEIGRFAQFLRRRHFDELPQLLVVPLGWMSLVGPRPKMPDEFEPAPRSYTDFRTRVPQGCTGLWQIGRHTHLPPHESPEYDLLYVRQASLVLDLWIMGCTALNMLGLLPATDLDRLPSWFAGPSEADAEPAVEG